MAATIRICKKCSGVKAKDFKGVVDKGDIRTGCFGTCVKKNPELKGRPYVRVGKQIIAADSKKKLVKAVAAAL